MYVTDITRDRNVEIGEINGCCFLKKRNFTPSRVRNSEVQRLETSQIGISFPDFHNSGPKLELHGSVYYTYFFSLFLAGSKNICSFVLVSQTLSHIDLCG